MSVLENATPIIIVCTRDVTKTAAFYRDVLGLRPQSHDQYAVVFRAGGIDLRVSYVPDFAVTGHTGLSFRVDDLAVSVRTLREKGVVFLRPEGMTLDEAGIWTVPGGLGQVAWLTDPEGNIVSITTV
jgi:catechol 2,3-dioxygenase-like lactoylglutathione lyase family enzyme